MLNLLSIIVGYLAGSLSSAVVVCKLMDLPDPRKEGSQNPGATNVLRIGGKKAAAFTLVGDAMKGVIAVLVAKLFGLSPLSQSLVGLAAFFGHLYPVFFGFKGGKGVATGFGVVLGLYWPAGIALAVTWILLALFIRYSSLAALVTALLSPLYLYVVEPFYIPPLLVLVAMLIYRHRGNIQRLWRGEESKISF